MRSEVSKVPVAGDPDRPKFRAWDHRGVIAGVLGGLVVFAFLVVLAIAGDPSALAIIVVILAGLLLIFVMGRMRAGRG